jgi:hypothetical protein
MIAFCALLPLASTFVSLSYGGATTPFVLLQTIAFLPLIKDVGGTAARILTPLLLLSSFLRFASLVTVSKGALGSFGATVLAVICFGISCITAIKNDTVFRFAPPLFFVSAIFAAFVTVVSFSTSLRAPFSDASVIEKASSFVCPISSCVAFLRLADIPPLKRFYASTVGVALCAVFIIFDAAGAEFAFLSVPLAVLASSAEIKAVLKGIKG